jgi:cytochrome c
MGDMKRFACAALAVFVFSALSAQADESSIARGRAIAKENCGRCHALGRTGRSPNPKSPPFRALAQKYPLSNLEEALGEGIVVGHEGPEMPQFKFSTTQIEQLLAYLSSLQKK